MLFRIYNQSDLECLETVVRSKPSEDLDVELCCNVRLNPKRDWFPIGHVKFPFKGNFDGYGHTISGLSNSMFGAVKNGCIKNLTVEGIIDGRKILGESTQIAGIVQNLSCGTVVNCTNRVKCYSDFLNGGICAYGRNFTIKGCVNDADIIGNRGKGIVAYGNNDDLIYCGAGKNASIQIEHPNSIISNCINRGTIKFTHPVKSQDLHSISFVQSNNFKYNQIIGQEINGVNNVCTCSNNQQVGKVILPFQDSLFGLYMRCYSFHHDTLRDIHEIMCGFIKSDPNTEHLDSNNNTYLHLLCRNRSGAFRQQHEKMCALILLLAEHTNIDFKAVNKEGRLAEHFLINERTMKPYKGYESSVKLIRTIQKERQELKHEQEDDIFSEIGW